MNLFKELMTAEKFKVYYEADTNRPPYIGEMFFPKRKQLGLDFKMVKGKQGLPVALVASGFDADVLYRDRISLTLINGELPFSKKHTKLVNN